MKVSLIGILTLGALLAQKPVVKKSTATYDKAKAQHCWTLKKTASTQESTSCFVALMAEKSPALSAEGLWGVGKLEDAKRDFEKALEVYPDDPQVRIRFGLMFWSRFNKADAVKLIGEALELDKTNPQGMMALARILSRGFDSKATDLAQKAAEADPSLFEARELLAQLALENSNEKLAAEEAAKALLIEPKSLNAMATLGTIELLKNQKTDQFDKIFAINPNYGEAWFWAGHHFVLNRRYEEGIELYKKAVALRPDLWDAREQLGINLMRTGKPDEARFELELAYNAGHHSSEVVNSLRLMDSYKNFVSHKFEGGEVRLHKKEAAILQPYFEEEVRRARTSFEAKYKMKLGVPLEV